MVGAEGSLLRMFQMYGGSGWLLLAFAGALAVLFTTEKKKSFRMILIYLSVLVVAVFFFPLTKYIVSDVLGEEETYYRILWLMPFGIVIPYAVIRLMMLVTGKILKLAIFIASAVVLCWGGTCIYTADPVFYKTENVYQIPQPVVDICDQIQIEGREVMALFPDELIPYVRQYTAFVLMPYGYGNIVDRWMLVDDLHETMKEDEVSTKTMVEMLREKGCQYLVVRNDKLFDEPIEDYDYTKVGCYEEYILYLDNTANLN